MGLFHNRRPPYLGILKGIFDPFLSTGGSFWQFSSIFDRFWSILVDLSLVDFCVGFWCRFCGSFLTPFWVKLPARFGYFTGFFEVGWGFGALFGPDFGRTFDRTFDRSFDLFGTWLSDR